MKPRRKICRPKTLWASRFVVALCGLSLLVVFSCSSKAAMRKADEDTFNLVVENFHNAVRWGEYDIAATYVGPALQEDFWKIADALRDRISIHECQIKRCHFNRTGRTGEVVLFVRYYAKENPELITRTIHERWMFNDKEKMWHLISHDLKTVGN